MDECGDVISRAQIFAWLEEAGRATTGGRQELTLREVFEARGGRGSHATRDIARDLGVTQRQVQRMLTEHGTERRGMGPKSMRYFRELSAGELRRAGARFYRNNPFVVPDGFEFPLCYDDGNGPDKQGDDREVRGDAVVIEDNAPWLDHFDAGRFERMRRVFTDLFLEAYGVSAGALDVCEEEEA